MYRTNKTIEIVPIIYLNDLKMFRSNLSSVILAKAPREKYIIHMTKNIIPRLIKLNPIYKFNYFHSFFLIK